MVFQSFKQIIEACAAAWDNGAESAEKLAISQSDTTAPVDTNDVLVVLTDLDDTARFVPLFGISSSLVL